MNELFRQKFRVWYAGVEMLYPEDVLNHGFQWFLGQDGKVYSFVRTDEGGEMELEEDATPLLATGCFVKDKDGNDKELYDGDIVDWDIYEDYPAFLIRRNDKTATWWLYLGDKPMHDLAAVINSKPDVMPMLLGNLYETPELMEV